MGDSVRAGEQGPEDFTPKYEGRIVAPSELETTTVEWSMVDELLDAFKDFNRPVVHHDGERILVWEIYRTSRLRRVLQRLRHLLD